MSTLRIASSNIHTNGNRCLIETSTRTTSPASGRRSQEMGLTMDQRKALTREMADRYRRASKPQKTAMLDEFVEPARLHPPPRRVGAADVGQDGVRAPRRRGGQDRGRPAPPSAPRTAPLRRAGRRGAEEGLVPVRLSVRQAPGGGPARASAASGEVWRARLGPRYPPEAPAHQRRHHRPAAAHRETRPCAYAVAPIPSRPRA